MLYVNDSFYADSYFEDCYQRFDTIPAISDCRGKRLAICLNDTAEWLALCLYLKERGASVLPLHPTTPEEAARRTARASGSHVFIFRTLEQIESLQPGTAIVEPGLVQFSSGSTGEPKRIERSWESIDQELEQYHWTLIEARSMTPVIACPTTHSYGLICGVLAALRRGQQPRVLTQLNPKYVIKVMNALDEQQHKGLLYSSPTFLHVLSRLLPEGEKLHAVMTSGAVMPQSHFQLLRQKVTHLFQQYGCSEAGCIAVNTDTRTASAIGEPLDYWHLSAGRSAEEPEEIVVSKLGPAGQGETISTQDLGYLDETGVLHFVSRIDDTINVAGINVYPQEVEDVILGFADIEDAVVFKKQDLYAGERVCLKVVSPVTVDLDALRNWCAQQLSPYQTPLEIQQVDHIAKLPNGKVNRKDLAAQAAQGASRAEERLRA